MKKDRLNSLLREHVRKNLSPTQEEQALVTKLYDAFKTVLGSCLQIGSIARYTASRPIHDLDILFLAGHFDPTQLNPQAVLTRVREILKGFRNPTAYEIKISQQTHSITVAFLEKGVEKFSVDIVPAFTSGSKNEFNEDIYWVPEIVLVNRRKRQVRYAELAKAKKVERDWWIKTDPRGYITAASIVNSINSDFRKTAKFIKRWKHNCKTLNDTFKLKSFHIEQVVYGLFKQNSKFEIADAIFQFFRKIPEIIARPQIPDRADSTKYIDEYVAALTSEERQEIIAARDYFLIQLEDFSEDAGVVSLLKPGIRKRKDSSETYLFDLGIPVFVDPEYALDISAKVLPRAGGFRERFLDAIGQIEVDRKIEFSAKGPQSPVDVLKWKVKNDDNSSQPRGEISDHTTKNDPEHTKFDGAHQVECFAIKNGVCVGRAKQNVTLKRFYS